MNKLLVIAVFMPLLLCHPLKAQDLRVGFADSYKILENSEVRKEINAHSNKLIEQLREFEKEQAAKLRAASAERRKAIRESIGDKRNNVKIALEINKNKMQAYLQTIRDRIKEVAERHSLSLVFTDERTIILVDDFMDITDEVIARINEQE